MVTTSLNILVKDRVQVQIAPYFQVQVIDFILNGRDGLHTHLWLLLGFPFAYFHVCAETRQIQLVREKGNSKSKD